MREHRKCSLNSTGQTAKKKKKTNKQTNKQTDDLE
jgi:hypothetical protein